MTALVGVVCDEGELRHRLRSILTATGLEIEATWPARPAAVERAACDAIVVAVSGNPTSTTGELKALRRRARDIPFVAIVPGTEAELGRAVISAGADAVVPEVDIEAKLVAAVGAASGGQLAFPERLIATPGEPSFSRREKQALGMVVLGFTNQEIAASLGLAESTIKGHLSSAFEKLGVSSRAEAAGLILDTANGLGLGVLAIEPDEEEAKRGSDSQDRPSRTRHRASR